MSFFSSHEQKRNILNLEEVKKDKVSEDRRKFLTVKKIKISSYLSNRMVKGDLETFEVI